MTCALVFAALLATVSSHVSGAHSALDAGPMRCGPQNMTLSPVPSEQRVVLTWQDDPFCLLLQEEIVYDVEVLSTVDMKTIHHDVVVVQQNQTGTIHHWSWASPVPLECAYNTFKVRAQNEDQRHIFGTGFSPTEPTLYPKDRVFNVGSNVTFCCVLPPGKIFSGMNVSGETARVLENTTMNNQTYALTVHLLKPTLFSGADVTCNNRTYGTTFFAGYRPRETDLRCETRDFESVECTWRTKKKTHLPSVRYPTSYELLGIVCSGKCTTKISCCQRVSKIAQERNWTLTAQNILGTVELTDQADLTKRVHMFAPQNLTCSWVNARNASLAWQWSVQQYTERRLLCHILLRYNGHTDGRNYTGLGLNRVLLRDLTPNLNYSAELRCGMEEHFWKWSDRKNASFKTQGDIPDALDICLWMEQSQAVILWKTLLPGQSHGRIIDYEVTWRRFAEPEETHNRTVLPPGRSVAIELEPGQEHVVTVTARNAYGRSLPASVVSTRLAPDLVTNVSWMVGSNGGFNLSWSAHPASSCGYEVVWTQTFTREKVDWEKVPPGVTRAFITENLYPGVRYSLCVYACTEGGPLLLERRQGYTEETRIPSEQITGLRWERVGSGVRVSWTAIPLKNRTAIIRGYVMHYQNMKAQDTDPEHACCNVTTDDAEATSLIARDIQVGSYSFRVAALTAVGEGGGNTITVTINPLIHQSIVASAVVFSLVFILLIVFFLIACKNWTCIKQKVCPPVPSPVLKCDWLPIREGRGPTLLDATESHSSQKENVDVPLVFCNRVLVSTDSDYVEASSQQNQRANGYFHQQPAEQMETTTNPHFYLPVLPFSPLPCIIENPLYTGGMQ